MRARTGPLVVLVTALAALVGSVGWAASNGNDAGMMSYGPGMMGYSGSGGGEPVRSLRAARRQAQLVADELDLRAGEVMRFSNNYYVQLREPDGPLATEVLVDPSSGDVSLEYGPAMMWNTRFGMMSDFRLRSSSGMMGGGMMGGGMMGGGMMSGSGLADPTWTPGTTGSDISAVRAQRLAQSWLDARAAGLAAVEPAAFPGYYTLHVLRDGKLVGMLSVNASTGAVWSHWWHGRFVSMLED